MNETLGIKGLVLALYHNRFSTILLLFLFSKRKASSELLHCPFIGDPLISRPCAPMATVAVRVTKRPHARTFLLVRQLDGFPSLFV
jgi:hypothetical protein